MASKSRKHHTPKNRQEWLDVRNRRIQTKPEPYVERRHIKSFLKEVSLQALTLVVIFSYSLFVGLRYDQLALMAFLLTLGVIGTIILPFFIIRSKFKWKEQPIEYDPETDLLYVHQWGSQRLFLQNSDPDSYSFSEYAVVTKAQTMWEQYIPWFNDSQTLVLRPIGSSEPEQVSWFDQVFRDVRPGKKSGVLVLKDVVDVGRILAAQAWHNSQGIRQNDAMLTGINEIGEQQQQTNRLLGLGLGEPPDDQAAGKTPSK